MMFVFKITLPLLSNNTLKKFVDLNGQTMDLNLLPAETTMQLIFGMSTNLLLVSLSMNIK